MRPSSYRRPSARLLERFDALSPRVAWALGAVTGMVAVYSIEDPRGLWAALLLPLLAVGLVRRAGLRPEPRRRIRGSLLTSLGLSIALGGLVVTLGQTLAFVTPTGGGDGAKDEPLPALRLEEPAPWVAGSTTGPSSGSDTVDGSSTGSDDIGGSSTTADLPQDGSTSTGDGEAYLPDEPPRTQDPVGTSDEREPLLPTGVDAPPTNDPPTLACPGTMVLFEGGSFKGGDGRRHEVEPFCIDATEVRVSAYRRCLEAGDATKKRGCAGGGKTVKTKGRTEGGQWDERCNLAVSGSGKDAHPINCVDWSEARTFCQRSGKRLPTEWEWEWAARGGRRGNRYPWGDGPAPSCNVTVMSDGGDGCGRGGTAPVGSMTADVTPDGVKDMGGNIEEWTSSSKGPKRVLRGGSWNIKGSGRFRVSNRQTGNPNDSFFYVGFRCADRPVTK